LKKTTEELVSFYCYSTLAWIEGTAILIAVFVVSTVSAWNDFKKEE
jgi:hypothetical protein